MNSLTYKSIATHALAVALPTAPWLLAFVYDIYGLASGVQETPTGFIDSDLASMLTVVSTVALAISILSFALYLVTKRR